MSSLVNLFMNVHRPNNLVPLHAVHKASAALGLPTSVGFARGLGLLGLVCTALYAYPRTSILGAVLLTGYYGATVLAHVRVDDPLFTHTLFGVYLGLMVWGGLYLRDERLREIFPLRA
jgi:hypothetical protein